MNVPPPYPYPSGYYYVPQAPSNARYSATPAPFGSKHSRRASQQHTSSSNYYAYPARGSGSGPQQYPDPRFAFYSSPLRNPNEHVSYGHHRSPPFEAKMHRTRSGKQSRDDPRYFASRRYASPGDDGSSSSNDEDEHQFFWDARYFSRHRHAPAQHHHQRNARSYGGTDQFYYFQQEYARAHAAAAEAKAASSSKANQSRPRRASHAAATERPSRPQTTPPKPAKPSPKKSNKSSPPKPRGATEEDARRAHIPAGYSLKNWDPAEEPITLLGSVFDANSLGKWIYDWTSYCHGHGAPLTDLAGDLWLLLIQLAGKYKRADEAIENIRQEENRELVEDFLESGERLWIRFKKLLKACEESMYRAAQRESGETKPSKVGANSGVAFVESMFGRDRELNSTEKLMANIRLWSMRFDANVETILQDGDA